MADVSPLSISKQVHVVVAETHSDINHTSVVKEPNSTGHPSTVSASSGSKVTKEDPPETVNKCNSTDKSQNENVSKELDTATKTAEVVTTFDENDSKDAEIELQSATGDRKPSLIRDYQSVDENHQPVGRTHSDSDIIVDHSIGCSSSKRKRSVAPHDPSIPSTSKGIVTETNSAPESFSRKNLKGILKTRSESQIILDMPILNAERQSIIGKFSNGTSVDDGTVTGVRFDLETELSGTTNTKRKRKSGRFKESKIASFVNPAFEEDNAINYKFADLVEQLLGHGVDDQADSHPYGRKACRIGNGRAFLDSGKFMIWFVLMIAMLGVVGGIIFLSETRKRTPVSLANFTNPTTKGPLSTTL